MKKSFLTVWICAGILYSCQDSKTEDFTDRVINVMLENPKGESIEFPDLYTERVKSIPAENDEKLILAEKLKARGFAVKSTDRGTSPLAGIRFVSVKLFKENCICEVTKTYRSSEFVSEYNATERVRCY